MKLYGIPNCSTVKKARDWLEQNKFDYTFHDFKKQGITAGLLEEWLQQLGWQILLNKKGTTWRKLDAATQASLVDAPSAIAIMLAHPSIIKRPILDKDGRLKLGFTPDDYEKFFQ